MTPVEREVLAAELDVAVRELAELAKGIRLRYADEMYPVEQVLDPNGRPVLVDVLTARTNALAALARLAELDG